MSEKLDEAIRRVVAELAESSPEAPVLDQPDDQVVGQRTDRAVRKWGDLRGGLLRAAVAFGIVLLIGTALFVVSRRGDDTVSLVASEPITISVSFDGESCAMTGPDTTQAVSVSVEFSNDRPVGRAAIAIQELLADKTLDDYRQEPLTRRHSPWLYPVDEILAIPWVVNVTQEIVEEHSDASLTVPVTEGSNYAIVCFIPDNNYFEVIIGGGFAMR